MKPYNHNHFSKRDTSLKETTVTKLEELQKEFQLETKQRSDNELDIKTNLESMNSKLKLYSDDAIESLKQIMSGEIETLKTRCKGVVFWDQEIRVLLYPIKI